MFISAALGISEIGLPGFFASSFFSVFSVVSVGKGPFALSS